MVKQKNIIYIEKAIEKEFPFIRKHIARLDLDDRKLNVDQFLVAKLNEKILGFGRIRKHKGCDEFCSLGVLEKHRNSGVAELLISERIKLATQPIYLVCIIPDFFKPLGFEIVETYPPEILDKLNYCSSELVVAEPYVVMNYKG